MSGTRNLNLALIICFFLAIFVFKPSNAMAEASELKKGQVAPYSGVLLEPKDFLKARIAVREAEQYKEQFMESKELMRIQDNRIANRDKIIVELNNQLTDSDFYKKLYFLGGVVLGGLAVDYVKD
jgi:hypothetical protein